jgi:hypothetical protein
MHPLVFMLVYFLIGAVCALVTALVADDDKGDDQIGGMVIAFLFLWPLLVPVALVIQGVLWARRKSGKGSGCRSRRDD